MKNHWCLPLQCPTSVITLLLAVLIPPAASANGPGSHTMPSPTSSAATEAPRPDGTLRMMAALTRNPSTLTKDRHKVLSLMPGCGRKLSRGEPDEISCPSMAGLRQILIYPGKLGFFEFHFKAPVTCPALLEVIQSGYGKPASFSSNSCAATWSHHIGKNKSQTELFASVDVPDLVVFRTGIADNTDSTELIDAALERFVSDLERGRPLGRYFANNWTLAYQRLNRCEGWTQGKKSHLKSNAIDSAIQIRVHNNGQAWDCPTRKPRHLLETFDLKNEVKAWDRFEAMGASDRTGRIEGAGASDDIELRFNTQGLVTRMTYRSEDPG